MAVAAASSTQQMTNCIQALIRNQFQDLRHELVKHDEVVAESQRAREMNGLLQEQLRAQQEHSAELEHQIQSLRTIETDLKAHSNHLKSELNDLKSIFRGPELGAESERVGQALIELPQELQKAREDLQLVTYRSNPTEQQKLLLQREIDTYKVRLDAFTGKIC